MSSPPRSATPRRRLTAAERREEILAAALEVFAARGYHDSSIDEIARAAGISKALIYEHFASKRDLHVSLLEAHVEELFARMTAAAAPGRPPDERLRAGVDAFLRFVEERRDAWRMLFRNASDPEVGRRVARLQAQATEAVAALMRADLPEPRGGRRPEARDEAIAVYALLLSGATQHLATWWADHPEVPRETLVDRVMELTWIGLERLRAGES